MSNLILTILFGYLGTYRFSKKQNKLGFVYLFTCGLFGIGWIYDIYLAYLDYKKSQKRFTDSTHQKQSQENFIEKNNTDTRIVSQTEETSHNIENCPKIIYDHKMNFNHLSLDDIIDTNPEEYIVFDCETTGLFPHSGDRIIEFCFLKYKNNAIIEKLTALVNPNCSLPHKITTLTGISDADLADKPTIDKFIDSIIKFINNQIIVGHNVNFDIEFLSNEISECNFNTEELNVSYIDTLEMVKKTIFDIENNKLSTLKKYLNIEVQSHRAEADCEVAQAVYEYCYKLLIEKVLNQRKMEINSKIREQKCLESMTDDEKEISNYFLETARNHKKELKLSFMSDKAMSFSLCGIEVGRIKFNGRKHYCKLFAGDFNTHEWQYVESPTKENVLGYIDDLFIYIDKEYEKYFLKYGKQ